MYGNIMINNFKKPDLNAPRYREKVLGLLNADLINEFKEKNPIYSKIDNNKLKNIIKLFNGRIWEEVIKNRHGVELPDSLGYIFIGTCPAAKTVNTNYALSKKYGKVLQMVKSYYNEWGYGRTLEYLRELNSGGKIPLTHRCKLQDVINNMYLNS